MAFVFLKFKFFEKDHLGDWRPEKDCMMLVTDVSTICAGAIFRVK